MNDYIKIAELLFPNVTKTPDYYLNYYKKRNLPEDALVTRFAPSPTGYLHLGSLYTSFMSYKLAKDSGGVFYLRIEDTDLERTIDQGVEGLVKDLTDFGIVADEGVFLNDMGEVYSKGEYGPYVQTERKEIYLTFVKDLIARGLAYPCFCTSEEVSEIRRVQEEIKEVHIGYWGEYAKHRNLTYEQVKEKLEQGLPFAVRLKSPGYPNTRVRFNDVIRGKIEMLDNVNDVVILKSDTQLPPYNLAHAVDDTLMGTRLVTRSSEWLNSTPEHLQIFKAIGATPPKYAHIAFVQRLDPETGNKRKLSKRKDPEIATFNLTEKGYPLESVYEYMLTLANSNFEDWRIQNPNAPISEFKLRLDKVSVNGPLFDPQKFEDVSKNVIAKFTSKEVYDYTLEWAKAYDNDFYKLIKDKETYCIKMLDIDRKSDKPHKDIIYWSDVKGLYNYFFNEIFFEYNYSNYEIDKTFGYGNVVEILREFLNNYNEEDEKDIWFGKIKEIATKFGYAANVKEYKNNPSNYKGSIVHVSNFIRVALTGSTKSLDLYGVCKLFGKDNLEKRITKFITLFESK